MTALTKLDIAAMRKADFCSLFHRSGKSFIRAVKRAKASEKDPFAQDALHEISVGFYFSDYSEGDSRITWQAAQAGEFEAYESAHNYDEIWQSILGLLREGDEIILCWKRDSGRNGYIAKANLHGDSVDMKIVRGEKTMQFRIASLVTEDNSARMIKVAYSKTRAAQKVDA